MSYNEFFSLSETPPLVASTTVAGVQIVQGLSSFEGLLIIGELQHAVGGALDIFLQDSEDGIHWYDFFHFTSIGVADAAFIQSYTPAPNDLQFVIGKNLLPLIPSNTGRGAHWLDRMRAVYKSGAGVSAGTAQTIKIFGYQSEG